MTAIGQLKQLAQRKRNPHDLFAHDKNRFSRFSVEACGLFLDYSKNCIDDGVFDALVQLANERNLPKHISNWLSGSVVNQSEQRPALHTLLRADAKSSWSSNHQYAAVTQQKQQMLRIADKIQRKQLRGCTGKPLTTVVNIGIGGSAMGVMAMYHALCANTRHMQCRFIINIDPANRHNELQNLDFASTLFLVSSKSFTTTETLTNYRRCLDQARRILGDDAQQHFIAITANAAKAREHSFSNERIVTFSDWVGGRFSVWSAVGLPLLLCYGRQVWDDFLAGAHAMDIHLATAPPERNMPMVMALIGLWQRNFMAINNHAVLCYSYELRHFAEHLQQVVMESNGKKVLANAEQATVTTGELLWGGENSNGQHSYYQWLHQGMIDSSCDFLILARSNFADQEDHDQLLSMALGQSRSLFFGDNKQDPHAHTAGGRQSNTIVLDTLNARTLGSLLALYEHKTVLIAMLWGINPFDQWGVEAGKSSAQALYPLNPAQTDIDTSTSGLLGVIDSCQRKR